jgi:hypothetical protein
MHDVNSLFIELKKIIPNIPDEVIKMRLALEVNKLPIMELETLCKDVDDDFVVIDNSLKTESKQFKIVELEDITPTRKLETNEWIIDPSEYSNRPWFKSAYMKAIAAHNEIDKMYYAALENLGIGHRYH